MWRLELALIDFVSCYNKSNHADYSDKQNFASKLLSAVIYSEKILN